MNSSRLWRFVPLLLFVVALSIRLVGISWGLPTSERFYSYHPDERQMLGAIANIDFFAGQLNPHFFNYPTLFIYFASLSHLICGSFGAPASSVWELSRDVLLHARLVSALFGALTVSVTYLLGREIGGRKLGVLAALLVCFAPAHVQHSHFATVDVAATFWVLLSLLFATRAVNFLEKAAKWLLWSALFAGLGAATKYNAIFVLVAPLCALFFLQNSDDENAEAEKSKIEYSKCALLALGIVGVADGGFLLGCPFSVLSFPEFWGDGKNVGVAYELLVHPKQGSGDIFTQTGNGWLYHATFNLPFAMTLPVALAALLGLVFAFIGMRKNGVRHYGVLVPTLAFSLFYFFALGVSQVRFLRYLLPLLPALAIFAALFARAVVSALDVQKVSLKLAIAAPLVLICAVGTGNVVWPLTQTDPRDAAKMWLDGQSEATPILVGLADLQNPLWFYTPPFWPQDAPPGSPKSWQEMQKNPRYDLVPIGLDATKLAQIRPRYFVWSAFQWRERERLRDAALLQMRQQLNIEYSMRAFENVPPLQLPGRAFVPHDFLYTNPRVEVWTRN